MASVSCRITENRRFLQKLCLGSSIWVGWLDFPWRFKGKFFGKFRFRGGGWLETAWDSRRITEDWRLLPSSGLNFKPASRKPKIAAKTVLGIFNLRSSVARRKILAASFASAWLEMDWTVLSFKPTQRKLKIPRVFNLRWTGLKLKPVGFGRSRSILNWRWVMLKFESRAH